MQGKREMHGEDGGSKREMHGGDGGKALPGCQIEADGEGLGMWVRLTGEF